MNDTNLDEWLNSLGLDSSSTQQNPPEEVPVETPVEESQTQELSTQDFDDILHDYGFTPPEDAHAEEITEESSGGEEREEARNTEEFSIQDVQNSDFEVRVEDSPFSNEEMNRLVALQEEVLGLYSQVASAASDSDSLSAPHNEPTSVESPTVSSDSVTASTSDSPSTDIESYPTIPLNSPTLLLDESTTRFSGAEWYNEIQKKNIIIAGCGGIGSNLAFQLSRMHPAHMVLYDDDTVETVNMAGQLYARSDVGKSKVSAIYNMITAYTNMQNIYALNQKFTDTSEPGDIMLCGFDSMSARRTFFDAWHSHMLQYRTTEERAKCLFLDGRLSIDTLQVFCVTGDNEYACDEYYNKYLFTDSEADATVCSMKQTTYLACMIGSIMTNLFTNFCANFLNPIIPYDLPFFIEYDAQNMIFKTIA